MKKRHEKKTRKKTYRPSVGSRSASAAGGQAEDYQVMKGTRSPGRDKVLRLCLGAGLTLRETTRALELSGNAVLYSRKRRDIILTVAINQKAGVDDANLLLYKYGEEPLA